ncbi:CASP8 and FADD-like apoptosis regulator isoform X1 [Esox lucius]|uniref:CASP8 and FADD-like apoptosis regulator isoform X1 n=2 Tax=Esox lucius TaxID=8010 RepID=UPI0005772A06|nr:CASP8 and FADD-like apoptosis regulator isoform X1 [Esox lucius]XP_010864354.1 CASP8 and FADD-like apoptosis regulator isoform X1 [Esox lucius]XP_019897089.1 CASP8 and FADD-like apoptosis regulator isoform X1 [Esox lucius]XP_034144651.1 CASP8 and FADD-like apoptosis regulator isoform X1 [Esox lucius]
METFYQKNSRICEELSIGECKKLLYLCGATGTGGCVADVREVLMTWLDRQQVESLYLVELLYTLRRFDLLRKVFRVSEQEVGEILGQSRAVSKYRVLMSDVSEDMGTEDLESLKFLLSASLPKERLASVKSFLDVVVELEKCDQVSSERVGLIEQYLIDISRVDLAKKVRGYQNQTPVVSMAQVQQRPVGPKQFLLSQPRAIATPVSYQSKQNPEENAHTKDAERRRAVCQSPMEVYRLRSDLKDQCLIIDCVGSDGDMLSETFSRLHFKVTLVKWPGLEDTLSILRQAVQQEDNQEADSLACCLISRATATDLLVTDGHRQGLFLDSIRQFFTPACCPSLFGKPKLFFIQTYLVSEPPGCSSKPMRHPIHREEDLETDKDEGCPRVESDRGQGCPRVESDGGQGCPRVESVPADADVFWSHCWTDVCQLEQRGHRSVYLQALREAALRGQSRRTSLVDIHTEMNGVIFDHNRRNPGARYNINLRHTLRKSLYFR